LAGRRTTILVATSGDTGSAAIAACLGSHRMRVVVLYPKGRVSNFQRRQMTTVQDENVQAVAVEGTFDDCQSLVKQAFADEVLGPKLTAMNSINFARVAAQAGYYLWAAAQHPDADFVVPTGNFGNAFSGWAAREMGAPIARLVIANNANHGLSDLVNNGFLVRGQVTPTLAPSMDIQIPSNLERYLYEVSGRDPNQVRAWQENLRTVGRLDLSPSVHQRVGAELAGAWFDDRQITGAIRRAYEEEGVLLDPHTAVAWEAGNARRRRGVNQVVLATADPVKFSSAILAATGLHPDLPVEFAQILSAPERTEAIANDYAVLLRLLNETHSSNE
jgi:threonine synthase